MRTIDSFEDYVEPIDETINDIFPPVLFGQMEPLSDELRELFTLLPAQGGLGIPDLKAEAPQQYAASKLTTTPHVAAIRTQSTFMKVGEQSVEDLKRQQQSLKTMAANLRREAIDASLSPSLLRSTMLARDKGANAWLNAVPLEEQGLALNKQQFRDSLCLRYNLQLADLPSHCACGDRFTVSHALSCKKGGFVAQRHDGIRNLLTSLLNKVCKNVEVEPQVVKGAQMVDFLASDWSSDVMTGSGMGNRGPGVKRDRGLTGSHVVWETADQVEKGIAGSPEVTWFGKLLTRGKKGIVGSPEVT